MAKASRISRLASTYQQEQMAEYKTGSPQVYSMYASGEQTVCPTVCTNYAGTATVTS